MQVRIRVFWHVVVEDDINALNIHTASKQVSCDQNTLK
jgi:hypothetical protein